MSNLNCSMELKRLLETSITFKNHENLTEYISSSAKTPAWEDLLWNIPELREQFALTLNALIKELSPNYLSGFEIYDSLWELFKEVNLNFNHFKSTENLTQILSDFEGKVKTPLSKYDILVEINNLDIGNSNYSFGNMELFKLTREKLTELYLIKDDTIIENTVFTDWLGKSVIKTQISVSSIKRVHEVGLAVTSNLLEVIRLIAFRGNQYRNDKLFFWKLGRCMTIIQNAESDIKKVQVSFNLGFKLPIVQTDKILNKGLDDNQVWKKLLVNSLSNDINNRLYNSIRWITQAIKTFGFDFKVLFLCTALEIMLLRDKNDKPKSHLLAIRHALLGHGNGYTPESLIYWYDKRSTIIHEGVLEITGFYAYWTLLDCCYEVLRNIVNFSTRNLHITQYDGIIGLLDNKQSLQEFLDNCSDWVDNKTIAGKLTKTAENRLKQKTKS